MVAAKENPALAAFWKDAGPMDEPPDDLWMGPAPRDRPRPIPRFKELSRSEERV